MIKTIAMRLRGIATAVLCSLLLITSAVGLSACSVDKTNHSITVDNGDARQIIAAAAFAVNEIESLPIVTAHIPADKKAGFDKALADIQGISVLAAKQSSTVTLKMGDHWEQDLINDIQTLADIAMPIVQQYAPSVVPYIQTVQNLIPLIESFLPLSEQVKLSGPLATTMPLASANRGNVLSAIYAGPAR